MQNLCIWYFFKLKKLYSSLTEYSIYNFLLLSLSLSLSFSLHIYLTFTIQYPLDSKNLGWEYMKSFKIAGSNFLGNRREHIWYVLPACFARRDSGTKIMIIWNCR